MLNYFLQKMPSNFQKIITFSGDGHTAQTEVCMPNQNPIWNSTLTFDIGNGDHLIDRNIEVNLYDLVPQNDSIFLGECTISLQVRKLLAKKNFNHYFFILDCFNRGPSCLVSFRRSKRFKSTNTVKMSSCHNS